MRVVVNAVHEHPISDTGQVFSTLSTIGEFAGEFRGHGPELTSDHVWFPVNCNDSRDLSFNPWNAAQAIPVPTAEAKIFQIHLTALLIALSFILDDEFQLRRRATGAA